MKILVFIKDNYIRLTLFLLACLVIIFSVSHYNRKCEKIYKGIDNLKSDSAICLKVVSYPTYEDGNSKMICKVIKCSQKSVVGSRTRLTVENPDKKSINFNDTLYFKGTLKVADSAMLKGAFDYKKYLKSINVTSKCFIKYDKIKITQNTKGMQSAIYRLRCNFLENVDKYFIPEYASLVKALVTGDRTDIDEDTGNNLKKAGVYHIVAISGLHLNIFILYITSLLSSLKMKKYRKNILMYAICILCSVFILIFTGWGVSLIRAFSMLAVLFASNIFTREYNTKNALLISAIVILIFAPYNIYSSAFYLSYLSTFAVLISADLIKYAKNRWHTIYRLYGFAFEITITSVMTIIMTLPVTASDFGYIPLYSWFANLIILPVMTPLLGSCVIFAGISLFNTDIISRLVSYPIHALCAIVMYSSESVSNLPFSTINIYPQALMSLILFILCVITAVYCARKFGILRAVCGFSVILILLYSSFLHKNGSNELKINFVNVGQGDCTLIELPDKKTALIDCGTQNGDSYFTDNIDSFLRYNNIKTIDMAFVSHLHEDHTLGIMHLLEEGKIKNLFLPAFYDKQETEGELIFKKLTEEAMLSNTKLHFIQSGSKIENSEVKFTVITPDSDMYYDNNNMSAVIKLEYGEISALFTGDIENDAIRYCMKKDIDCDIIKVPHHGSKNSASDEFYKKCSPEYAVISCGKNNVYGHPHDNVLKLLENNNIQYLRTDKNGVITFTLNKKEIINLKTTG